MLTEHACRFTTLTDIESYILWSQLHKNGLVEPPTGPDKCTGEMLAFRCRPYSHADVVLSVATEYHPIWYSILGKLIGKPIYKCRRGESGIRILDDNGKPIANIARDRGRIQSSPSPRSRRVDTRIITVLVDYNPKVGRAATRFALYQNGQTVQEFLDLGGDRRDIGHDVERCYIRVDVAEIRGEINGVVQIYENPDNGDDITGSAVRRIPDAATGG
jgi:hypothetical protein